MLTGSRMTWLVQTLLSNAVLVGLLAIPVWGVTKTVRRPALTHALWTLLLLKLITPPIVPVALPWEIQLPSSIEHLSFETNLAVDQRDLKQGTSAGSRAMNDVTGFATSGRVPFSADRMSPIDRSTGISSGVLTWFTADGGRRLALGMIGIWLLGSGLMLFRMLRKLKSFCREIRGQGIPAHELQNVLEELCCERGVRRVPRGVLVEHHLSPMIFGCGPCVKIVFPRALWESLEANSRRSLLLHELAHYERGDLWISLLEVVCVCVYWWHPVVWWAKRRIDQAQEECCDAFVVRAGEPRVYADAIITTLDFLSDRPAALPPLASGVSGMPILRARLTKIMRRSVSGRLSITARRGVALCSLIVLTIHPSFVSAAASVAKQNLGSLPKGVVAHIADRDTLTETAPDAMSQPIDASLDPGVEPLPPVPAGWWSTSPERDWARVVAPDRSMELSIEMGHRVVLRSPDGDRVVDLSDAALTCAAFLPSGRRLVAGGIDGSVRILDAATGEAVSFLGSHSADVKSISVDHDGEFAATGAADGSVIVWDLSSGAILETWMYSGSPVASVRFSPDRSQLAVAVGGWREPANGRIVVIDLQTQSPIAEIALRALPAAIDFVGLDRIRIAVWHGQLLDWNPFLETLTRVGEVSRTQLTAASFSQDVRL